MGSGEKGGEVGVAHEVRYEAVGGAAARQECGGVYLGAHTSRLSIFQE